MNTRVKNILTEVLQQSKELLYVVSHILFLALVQVLVYRKLKYMITRGRNSRDIHTQKREQTRESVYREHGRDKTGEFHRFTGR